MYRRLDDFRFQFQEEVEDTLKVFRAIPDTAAHQAVTPEHRDLRRMAWHLVESLVSLPQQIGLDVDGPAVNEAGTSQEPIPAAMSEIIARYQRAAGSLVQGLADWEDADLLKEDNMFGHMVWAKGYSLRALEMHQAHHRGQMTVLMRQAGLKVPGFYGPALEDWAAMGAPAPVV
jgi:uncharacterized damage-inducible protein DinB